MLDRYPILDEELPEWIQRQMDDADPLPQPWTVGQRLALGVAFAVLSWTLIVFAIIGAAAVFGSQP